MARVLITGVAGQDGFYLSEICHARGFEVYGLMRGQDNPKARRLASEQPYIKQIQGDLLDRNSICHAFDVARPDYVFNLGAITYIPFSWEQPELVYETNFVGVQRLLDECTTHGVERFVQASTSEMFGNAAGQAMPFTSMSEISPMRPRSPYAIAKLAAHHLCLSYAAANRVDAVSAIMFNHESPRRGENFVTRKITLAAARIKLGHQEKLTLGNVSAVRDWGYAKEYMDALLGIATWGRLDHASYVLATGQEATVLDFAVYVWRIAGLPDDSIEWREADKRVNDVSWLKGDATRIRQELGWKAEVDWRMLAQLMYQADLNRVENGEL